MRHFGGINQGRQSDKAKLLLWLGSVFVVLLGTAVFLLYGSATANVPVAPAAPAPAAAEPAIKMVDVLVPIQKIDPGTPLEPSLFRRESRPQVGLDVAHTVKDFEEIRGQYAKSLIISGQPLHKEQLNPQRPSNLLTGSIPDNYRAVTISVDAKSSVEGFALPGARVDVVWVSRIRDKPGVTVIVQNAKVLSAERKVDPEALPGAPVPSTVTLLVTADDAAKIQLASTTGSLSLSLRGDNDMSGSSAARSITVDDLLGGSSDTGNQAPKGPTVTVRGPDGRMEHFVFSNGKLIPAAE